MLCFLQLQLASIAEVQMEVVDVVTVIFSQLPQIFLKHKTEAKTHVI